MERWPICQGDNRKQAENHKSHVPSPSLDPSCHSSRQQQHADTGPRQDPSPPSRHPRRCHSPKRPRAWPVVTGRSPGVCLLVSRKFQHILCQTKSKTFPSCPPPQKRRTKHTTKSNRDIAKAHPISSQPPKLTKPQKTKLQEDSSTLFSPRAHSDTNTAPCQMKRKHTNRPAQLSQGS